MTDPAWLIPSFEVLHYLGIVLWVGAVAVLDFRLLGLARHVPLHKFYIGPTAIAGAALVLITGGVMYGAMPAGYGQNPAFQAKVVLLLLATATAFAFHSRYIEKGDRWERGMPPLEARLAGALSLVLWFGVLVAGRLVAYLGPAQG